MDTAYLNMYRKIYNNVSDISFVFAKLWAETISNIEFKFIIMNFDTGITVGITFLAFLPTQNSKMWLISAD